MQENMGWSQGHLDEEFGFDHHMGEFHSSCVKYKVKIRDFIGDFHGSTPLVF
jgi:hypothetical protein